MVVAEFSGHGNRSFDSIDRAAVRCIVAVNRTVNGNRTGLAVNGAAASGSHIVFQHAGKIQFSGVSINRAAVTSCNITVKIGGSGNRNLGFIGNMNRAAVAGGCAVGGEVRSSGNRHGRIRQGIDRTAVRSRIQDEIVGSGNRHGRIRRGIDRAAIDTRDIGAETVGSGQRDRGILPGIDRTAVFGGLRIGHGNILQRQAGAGREIESRAIGSNDHTAAIDRDVGHHQSGGTRQHEHAGSSIGKGRRALDRQRAGVSQAGQSGEVDRNRSTFPGQLAVQQEMRIGRCINFLLQRIQVESDGDVAARCIRDRLAERVEGIACSGVIGESIDLDRRFRRDLAGYDIRADRIFVVTGNFGPVVSDLVPGIAGGIAVEITACDRRIVHAAVQGDNARRRIKRIGSENQFCRVVIAKLADQRITVILISPFDILDAPRSVADHDGVVQVQRGVRIDDPVSAGVVQCKGHVGHGHDAGIQLDRGAVRHIVRNRHVEEIGRSRGQVESRTGRCAGRSRRVAVNRKVGKRNISAVLINRSAHVRTVAVQGNRIRIRRVAGGQRERAFRIDRAAASAQVAAGGVDRTVLGSAVGRTVRNQTHIRQIRRCAGGNVDAAALARGVGRFIRITAEQGRVVVNRTESFVGIAFAVTSSVHGKGSGCDIHTAAVHSLVVRDH